MRVVTSYVIFIFLIGVLKINSLDFVMESLALGHAVMSRGASLLFYMFFIVVFIGVLKNNSLDFVMESLALGHTVDEPRASLLLDVLFGFFCC